MMKLHPTNAKSFVNFDGRLVIPGTFYKSNGSTVPLKAGRTGTPDVTPQLEIDELHEIALQENLDWDAQHKPEAPIQPDDDLPPYDSVTVAQMLAQLEEWGAPYLNSDKSKPTVYAAYCEEVKKHVGTNQTAADDQSGAGANS